MARNANGGDSTCMSQSSAPVKVFLADDSAVIRSRVASLLRANGMEIVGEAETTQSAIDGILAVHPDAVVLDVLLKDGTGMEVLRAVQQSAPDIGFVVFSIHAIPAYRKSYVASGAKRFLDKASEFDQLVAALAEARS